MELQQSGVITPYQRGVVCERVVSSAADNILSKLRYAEANDYPMQPLSTFFYADSWLETLAHYPNPGESIKQLIASVHEAVWATILKISQRDGYAPIDQTRLTSVARLAPAESGERILETLKELATVHQPTNEYNPGTDLTIDRKIMNAVMAIIQAKLGQDVTFIKTRMLAAISPESFQNQETRGITIETVRAFQDVARECAGETDLVALQTKFDSVIDGPAFGGTGDPEAAYNILKAMREIGGSLDAGRVGQLYVNTVVSSARKAAQFSRPEAGVNERILHLMADRILLDSGAERTAAPWGVGNLVSQVPGW